MILGLDIGYRYTSLTNGTQTITFPSVMTPDPGHLALFTSQPPQPLIYDHKPYLIGDDALETRLPLHTLDRHRTTSPEYKLLFVAALYRLFGQGKRNLRIVTGLPHEDLADKSLVVKALSGTHRLKIGGRSISYSVSKVKVIPQALGSLTREIFTFKNNRLALHNPDLMTGATLTVDFGGLTVNFQKFVKARYIHDQSTSIEAGMVRVLEQLKEQIRAKYDLKLNLHQADEALRLGYVTIFGQPHDITTLAQPLVEQMALTAAVTAKSLWSEGSDAPYLFLTGGGAYHLKADFLRHYPHPNARALKNPHLANVEGFYLYGLGLEREAQW